MKRLVLALSVVGLLMTASCSEKTYITRPVVCEHKCDHKCKKPCELKCPEKIVFPTDTLPKMWPPTQ